VVLASEGYPQSPIVGLPITSPAASDSTIVFHAGTAERDGSLISSGGRVMTVTGIGNDLESARHRAYSQISTIVLEGSFYRSDIALVASLAQVEN
jgi:phosphoribosylamine--glycine ligase